MASKVWRRIFLLRKLVWTSSLTPNTAEYVPAVEKKGTRLITDKTNRLGNVAREYYRHTVDHHSGEYVRGDIYVNNIEGFWAHVKRSISGTHKAISKKYLQSYLDGFVFHYNNRHSDRDRFAVLLGTLLHGAK